MDDQARPVQLPILHEHDFRSSTPIAGPLIGWLRRTAYRLSARWGVWSVIGQQNHVNRLVAQHLDAQQARAARDRAEMTQYLAELDRRLIDQDRELTQLRRTVAELELRQRRMPWSAAPNQDQSPAMPSSSGGDG